MNSIVRYAGPDIFKDHTMLLSKIIPFAPECIRYMPCQWIIQNPDFARKALRANLDTISVEADTRYSPIGYPIAV